MRVLDLNEEGPTVLYEQRRQGLVTRHLKNQLFLRNGLHVFMANVIICWVSM